MPKKETHQNRLKDEKSPYLLQHADNPVDWYPWGEEAFEKARKEDKPIFLSIGYSTCHWCHVMEHESFEDLEIAKRINEYFVPIKVDREERPDIDQIYMTAVQAMTGRGGWPLTVFLTADKKPFFGGTYFPPQAKWGSAGLADILHSVHNAWQANRAQIIQSGEHLTEMMKAHLPGGSEEALAKEVLKQAYVRLAQNYDNRYGGFGQAPKFPTSHNLSFLLKYWYRTNEAQALEMVTFTLSKMAEGGMADHIGGGFHRYSTDEMWQVPHFEKMLYDQALLAKTYLEAYQITHETFYADVARGIFDYVLRDLQHRQGGFYSAEDADSLEPMDEGGSRRSLRSVGTPTERERTSGGAKDDIKKEGAFYLWRYDELKDVLNQEELDIFSFRSGIKPDGNAINDPHEEFVGKNIVYGAHALEDVAVKFSKSKRDLEDILERVQERLFDERIKRPRPHLDDKILVDWNGLMISALAMGSRVLNEPAYLEAAERAAQLIEKHLVSKKGRLLHRYREGEAAILGTLDDHAFLVAGLLDLYEASFNVHYLQRAFALAEDMVELFWDEESGGFFFTGNDAEKLIYRSKELYDGAIPSGNSVAALVMVRLYHISLDKKWQQRYEKLLTHFSAEVSQAPQAYTQMLMAFDFALGPSQEIVLSAGKDDKYNEALLEEIFQRFIPSRIVLSRRETDKSTKELLQLAPFVKDQLPINGKTTVYLCENHVCQLPVHEAQQLKDLLNKIRRD
ncbi:MAG TPA: thioredoxin domain-containing protein [Candidatus Omnitrophota bacterium]|nr:thioredoxin domain-containing protein [Candidatus Omnitrophota bacterium]